MAKKEDRKKQKQRLREKKKETRHRHHLESLRPVFPEIRLVNDCRDPVFFKAVSDVIDRWSYTDDAHCPPEFRANYRTIAKVGWPEWDRQNRAAAKKAQPDAESARLAAQEAVIRQATQFGTWVFENLPPQYTTRFNPEYFFKVNFTPIGMAVSFTLMSSVEDKGQRLYIPRSKPHIHMQGTDWQVALYPHALDRLCSRLVPQHSLTYTNCTDVWVRFHQKVILFAPTSLPDGQEAARVDFIPPLATFFYERYAAWVRAILGLPDTHDFSTDRRWAIVLGYLPLHIQGKYARAKTFLLPGFVKTPEYALAKQKARSNAEWELLTTMTDENTRTFDVTGDAFAAIKWYHDNGVLQVARPRIS